MFRIFFVLAFAAAAAAQPTLTTIQDTLYKADGTPFSGVAFIEWKSFESGDRKNIPTQSIAVGIIDGLLRVQLAPTVGATPASYYLVRYNSDGRVQFTEAWSVPASTSPLRLRDVRMAGLPGSNTQQPPPVAPPQVTVTDVIGLGDELAARVVRGPGFLGGRAAIINSSGMLEAVVGSSIDCVRVDGTSGPCGAGAAAGFVDNEAPAGAVNGTNAVFTLANVPTPASSLMLYRNGLLQRSGVDYTISGNTVTFAAGAIPGTGDVVMASYRMPSAAVNGQAGGVLTGEFPAPSLAAGVVSDYNISATAAIAESKLALNHPTHSNLNDPTAEQKAALAGTSGTVSGANRFVTNQDPRMTDARPALAHGLLSSGHSDTTAAGAVRGDLIVAQGTSPTTWRRLPLGAPNRCLTSNGADAVWNSCLFTGFTGGAVPFVDGTGSLTQNARFFWDNTNRRLGVGNNAPSATLQVHDATPITGVTGLVVRGGQGQGANALQRWLDANGTELARLETSGTLEALRLADREGGQTHAVAQVVCSAEGTGSGNTTMTTLGGCTLPAGFLQLGDRLETRFDYSHEGSAGGAGVEVRWGAATVLTRDITAMESLLAGRLDGSVGASQAYWSGQNWGSVTAIQPTASSTAEPGTGGVTVQFRGRVMVSGDTITLRQFTVLRYRRHTNP
ncbi:MAG: hypothetical protein SFV54_26890 [Bryobacteraceae bacterium]|nr:hypothetical protein [Bryobacteraceae bacterium]